MMVARSFPTSHAIPLIARLPQVRGRLSADADLSKVTWFRVGGPAEVLFKPSDLADLQQFLKECDPSLSVQVIGVGSNLLVRDGGVEGVVVRLGRDFAGIEVMNNHQIRVGGAALDVHVATAAAQAGIAGLEFLTGIPGTIGGALRMNAGAYGTEIKDVLVNAQAVDRNGALHQLTPDQMDLSYRHCGVDSSWIFTSAVLQGQAGEPAQIFEKLNEIQAQREASQPIRARTGGSTFANPEGHKAWQLIDQAGCRGLKMGGAQVSEKHTNFLINNGDATALDLESLGEEVRMRVRAQSGIELKWEIRRIGSFPEDQS